MVYNHHRSCFPASHGEAENGVVSRVAVNDFEDFARAYRDADGVLECAIQDGRNLSGAACAARFILTARGTHLGGDGNIFSHFILPTGSKSGSPATVPADVGSSARELYTNKLLTDVSS